jgi:hypothetical protein
MILTPFIYREGKRVHQWAILPRFYAFNNDFRVQASAGFGGMLIIVAEHHNYEIAWLQLLQDFGPSAFLDVAPAAASSAALVNDVDLCRIEKRHDLRSPTPGAFFAVTRASFHDGIADEEQRGELRQFRRLLGFLRQGGCRQYERQRQHRQGDPRCEWPSDMVRI